MTTTTTPNSASLAQGALGSLNNLGSSSGTTIRAHKRSAPDNKIPPKAKQPLAYLREGNK